MEIDKLAAALVKAQGMMKTAKKDSVNPFFKSKYADLGAVWEACADALHANGLAISQATTFRDGHTFLVTNLIHTSGQMLAGEYIIKPVKEDPQAYGSAVTYARRYALAAMVGVISEDDDGEAAHGRKDGHAAKESYTPPKAAPSEYKAPVALAKAAEVFKKAAAPAAAVPPVVQAEESVIPGAAVVAFVPKKVTRKDGSSKRGPWVKYGILSPDGKWYGTFEENLGKLAESAQSLGVEVTIDYTVDGEYFNVARLRLPANAPEAPAEEVMDELAF